MLTLYIILNGVMFRNVVFTILSLVLISNVAHTQTPFIENPSFESSIDLITQATVYPSGGGQINVATYWSSPTDGSPDYYHKSQTGTSRQCIGGPYPIGIPMNTRGHEDPSPWTGNAYAGFLVANSSPYDREYLRGKLGGLIMGRAYKIMFKISLAEASNANIFRIGVLVGTGLPDDKTGSNFGLYHINGVVPTPSCYVYPCGSNGSDDDWQTVVCFFVATGTEDTFIIGSFDSAPQFSSRTSNPLCVSFPTQGAYYYVDDFSIEDQHCLTDCNLTATIEAPSPPYSGLAGYGAYNVYLHNNTSCDIPTGGIITAWVAMDGSPTGRDITYQYPGPIWTPAKTQANELFWTLPPAGPSCSAGSIVLGGDLVPAHSDIYLGLVHISNEYAPGKLVVKSVDPECVLGTFEVAAGATGCCDVLKAESIANNTKGTLHNDACYDDIQISLGEDEELTCEVYGVHVHSDDDVTIDYDTPLGTQPLDFSTPLIVAGAYIDGSASEAANVSIDFLDEDGNVLCTKTALIQCE